MIKIRKQAYTMRMFMEYTRDKDIRDDADVQRASGQWTPEQINELIVTVLTDGYIPPIFIGEDGNRQKWLIDGLQRSTSLKMYRYGNYRITSAVRNPLIRYRTKARDGGGNIVKDENGDIVWEEAEFDIQNRTYEELPDELKKQFDSFQMETVIFEECTMEKMSELIQIYNNHTPMNTTQKAFTYISNYARDIREILENRFFTDCSNYTEKEKTKGIMERVVLESVMCMFHLDKWKKQAKQMGIYLNENSSKEEFGRFNEYLHRLEKVITEDVRDIFNSKDSFIWLTLFDRFSRLSKEDSAFIAFLRAFKGGLRNRAVDGQLFDEVDKGKGTKDKAVVVAKIHILESLMREYLHIQHEDSKETDLLAFLRDTVKSDITQEDVELYEEVLEDLTLNVDNSSKLLDQKNRPSLMGIVAYSFVNDIDLDDWIVDYFERNKDTPYLRDQKENCLFMIRDLKKYLA